MSRRAWSLLALVAALVVTAAPSASAQGALAARFRVEDGEPHAGKPFTLAAIIEGFEETPVPELPALTVANATVVPLGAQPSVSQSIQIFNGRRVDSREVRWVLRYRVDATNAGVLQIPSITVVQGSKRVVVQGGEVKVAAIDTTDDMKLELRLPDRPVWVGEVVPVEIVYLLRRNSTEQTLIIPMLEREQDFAIAAPPITNEQQTVELPAGARTLRLPYEQDQVELAGVRYTRFRISFFASPRRAGKTSVGAASVVAELAVGRPDIFGRAATRMFRAVDVPRVLDVKELPLAERPASFAGAVGSTFGISTSASRSVVQLGEPVELTITIRSDQRLDALAPPPLTGEGGLPAGQFTLPPDPPTGELSADGTTKTFKVAVQVTGPATEIPALTFSYFDPVKGTYQTTKSQPIALAVRGGSVVGAGDVVAAPSTTSSSATPAAPAVVESLAGADLVLSAPSVTTAAPLGGARLWIVVGLLYLVPLGLFGVRSWQRRTAAARGEAAELRGARRRVEAALEAAARAPARDSAGPLAEALRALARAAQATTAGTAIDRLENEAYAPGAADTPLAAELRRELSELAARWAREARRVSGNRTSSAALALLVSLAAGAGTAEATTPAAPPAAAPPAAAPPAVAGAAPPTAPPAAAPPAAATIDETLAAARAEYRAAMETPTAEVSERRERFGRAAEAFAKAAEALPGRAELYTDWGNAALGAGDLAAATLAYRRALLVEPEHPRASHNLALLRSKQAEAYRASATSATGTLFFFHTWSRSRRLLVGAVAFALAVLLVVPWRATADGGEVKGWARSARALALVPLVTWAAMTLSLVLEDRRRDDAVVMESVVVRAADSASAPAALSTPVPRGAEVVVVARRERWARIRLSSGVAGWVPTTAIALVGAARGS